MNVNIDPSQVVEFSKWITALGVIIAAFYKVIKPIKQIFESIVLMQYERLENAHVIYVEHLKFCPSGEKRALSAVYQSYKCRGHHNGISDKYMEEILALPTMPPPKE